jgi:hypothetical protein
VWEVFTSRQAYQGLHYGAVVERVVIQKQRPPIPEDMPDEYSLLMSSCWDAEPNNRPSFSQIVTCLELMIDNLTNEAEIAGNHHDDISGAYVQGSSSTAAAAAAAAQARFAASTGGGSSDQVAVLVSGASAVGAAGSTGGSNASAWQQQQQQQQQRLVLPMPALPPVAIAGRASTGSQSGQHVGVLSPTQLQQQHMQSEQSTAGQDRNSAGRLAAAAAAGAAAGAGAGHVTPHTTHSTGSQVFASGANVLDSNQYLQDL